jgi:hypothetical protein
MKNYIIVAAISAVVSVFTWEAMYVITGADAPEPQKANNEFIWRKHV